eukprot:4209503-Karenia_brevis.AAC.1
MVRLRWKAESHATVACVNVVWSRLEMQMHTHTYLNPQNASYQLGLSLEQSANGVNWSTVERLGMGFA